MKIVFLYDYELIVENNISSVLSFIFHPSVEGNYFQKVNKMAQLVGSPQLSICSNGNLYKSLEERTFKTFPLNLRIGILKGVLIIINEKYKKIYIYLLYIDVMQFV